MKTLHQSDGESLLVSDELENRLSHFTQDETPEYPECTVTLPDGPRTFSILAWDTDPKSWDVTQISVVIEIDRSSLRFFFDQQEPVRVEIFGRPYETIRTDAKLEKGDWTARLYLDRLDGDI